MMWNTVYAVTFCLIGVWPGFNEAKKLRRSLETERQRDKTTVNRLQQEVDKLRLDLDNETLQTFGARKRRQTLEEEIGFMKKFHEQGSVSPRTANRNRRAISMITEANRTPDGFLTSNEMSDIFLKFDVNGDGAIDETEFKAYWSILKLGDPDYARLFYYFDRNVDGKISETEFVGVWFSVSA